MLKTGFRLIAIGLGVLMIVACAGKSQKAAVVSQNDSQVNVTRPQLTPQLEADYQRAVDTLRAGDLAAAKQGFTALLLAEPRLAGAQVNLGIIAQHEGNKEAAALAFDRALALNASNSDALAALGVLALQRGEYRKAESLLLQALEGAPQLAIAHYNLGALYELYLQEKSDAIEHYKRYVALSSEPDVKTVKQWLKLLER